MKPVMCYHPECGLPAACFQFACNDHFHGLPQRTKERLAQLEDWLIDHHISNKELKREHEAIRNSLAMGRAEQRIDNFLDALKGDF